MSRKGENIHKRKDGRWEARITVRSDFGQARSISVYGKSYREVKNKKIAVQTAPRHPRVEKGVLVSRIIEEWLAVSFINRKKSTRLKYQVIIDNHILPELGNRDIRTIDESVINAFLAQKLTNGRLDKKGGLSGSSVKTIGIILNSVYSYAVARGYCEPLKTRIFKPAADRKEIKVLNIELQMDLERKLVSDDSLAALGILIALNTGLRIGEICALKWDDIDLDNEIIHIRRTIARVESVNSKTASKTCLILDKPKTRTSVRDIPITSKLLEILAKARREKISEFVVSESKSFVSPRTFEYRYHRVLEKYNVPSTNFHCLRHTFATRCVEQGVDIKTLSEILGHANVGITLNTYVHSSWDLKRVQLEKLSAIG